MLLQDQQKGILVEVLDLESLITPTKEAVLAQGQAGQEEQEPETFNKRNLIFPSGESLPRCWVDPDYRHSLN